MPAEAEVLTKEQQLHVQTGRYKLEMWHEQAPLLLQRTTKHSGANEISAQLNAVHTPVLFWFHRITE